MNRITVALLAAFDAALSALIGIAIPLVPLTVLWAVQYHTAVDWGVFWRIAADFWLLGHGADLQAGLAPDSALALGLPGGTERFAVTIAPLAFSLLTLFLGVRTGRRAQESPFRAIGILVAIGTYLVLALLVVLSSSGSAATVDPVQGTVLPPLVFALGVLIGAALQSAGSGEGGRMSEFATESLHRLPAPAPGLVLASLRGGALATAGVIGAAAVLVAVLVVANYTAVVALYEALGGEALGGFTLTLGQVAFVPNLVIWAASWLIGPGFALGAGSSVSPAGTLLGPIPSIPVLAALPQGDSTLGFLGLLVPALAGFAAGWRMRCAVLDALDGRSLLRWGAAAAAGIGVVGGLLLGLLAWFSAGAAGPGRLAQVGPDPLVVGAVAALELALAAGLGLAAGRTVRG
ncbi:DUF6350 family protein [Rathayibacter rathayi]|uniref:cell division protein PerM n=1 Tax=Rathayibacter rathayi TaxID=33887 RepID=UPI000CE8481F|nr:DUF6350 family protein [Rathayibacter rathayi]PPG69417.1 hypothetical protein C5C02_06100 [Rathayibacter rathayi]PPG77178.1 hypothetical protein C5C23_05695 [Rathayibacter rathayi]PPI77833.1 hypothetical protein C5E03_02515 [Rathayibacter rathayi]